MGTSDDGLMGILGANHLPPAAPDSPGIMQLGGDLAGTYDAPIISSLTGETGIVTTAASILHTNYANSGATVYKGEMLRIVRAISLIQATPGNTDTTIWISPSRFKIDSCFARFTASVTMPALTSANFRLGTTIGGSELIATYTFGGNETIAYAPLGSLLSQLGSDLSSLLGYQKMYLTPITVYSRVSVVNNSITSGALEITILGHTF